MAAYKGAISLAKKLDKKDIADTLQETLTEEQSAATMVETMAADGIMERSSNVSLHV